jgi:hypothetical protein
VVMRPEELAMLLNGLDPAEARPRKNWLRRLPAGRRRQQIHIYDRPLQILACLLAAGFLLAILVRPVRPNQQA